MSTIREFISKRAVGKIKESMEPRELGSLVSVAQGGKQFSAAGILLPGLLSRVQRQHPDFVRCHFAIGASIQGDDDFEVGTEARLPAYIGIRTHRGSVTLTSVEHEEIYRETYSALRAALEDEIELKSRDKFWSIWGCIPTHDPSGHLRSAQEYEDFAIAQLLAGWQAVRNLWDDVEEHGTKSPLAVPTRTNNAMTVRPSTTSRSLSSLTRWMYRIVENPSAEELTMLGDEGWEAYAAIVQNGVTLVHMKRPVS